MRATWRDPDDITPGARRTPREIHGWRSYDPLRRMLAFATSGVTHAHIAAADKLREQVDLATMGYSAARPLIYVEQQPQPRHGGGAAAVSQVRAARAVRRVIALFSRQQLRMIEAIVLGNMTLRAWTRSLPGQPASQPVEKGKLLAILDVLAQHFASEIRDEIARGKRLPP
jgi:hypothetical protein